MSILYASVGTLVGDPLTSQARALGSAFFSTEDKHTSLDYKKVRARESERAQEAVPPCRREPDAREGEHDGLRRRRSPAALHLRRGSVGSVGRGSMAVPAAAHPRGEVERCRASALTIEG